MVWKYPPFHNGGYNSWSFAFIGVDSRLKMAEGISMQRHGGAEKKNSDRMYGIYRIGRMFSHHVHFVNPVEKIFGQDEQDLQDTFGSSGASPHRELVYGVALIDTLAVLK